MNVLMLVYGFIFVMFSWNEVLSATTYQPGTTEALFDELFTGYKQSLLPRCPGSHNVTVTIDVGLRQIIELHEREQIMTTNIWIRQQWNDCRLTWDPALYDNLTSLVVRYEDIWVPDITVYDSASEEELFPALDTFKPRINFTGMVVFQLPALVSSVCIINVRYFPFDSQQCSLKLGSWSQNGNEIDVMNKTNQGDLSSFIENTEWIVTGMPVRRNVIEYQCCPEPYPDVTYHLTIMRRPAFYILTMIFPCILVSFVACLVFLLPVESGEKVSLAITVLLSLTVFLLMLSEALPPSSNNFPLIGQYFAISMGLVSLSLLQTVLVINVAYRGTNGTRVHRWVRILFLKHLGRVLCVKPVRSDGHNGRIDQDVDSESKLTTNSTAPGKHEIKPQTDVTSTDDMILQLLAKLPVSMKNSYNDVSEKTKSEEINAEWKCLSDILDKLFLLIYLVVTIATTVTHLQQCVHNHNTTGL